MAFRFLAESFSARALPPRRPPNRPKATAAGFFSRSFVEVSTIVLASVFTSVLERLGIDEVCHNSDHAQVLSLLFKLVNDPLPERGFSVY